MTAVDEDLEVLTTTEVAEILRVDVEWVQRACKAGRIRATKLGLEWRITRGAVRELLGAKSVKTPRERLTARQRRRS